MALATSMDVFSGHEFETKLGSDARANSRAKHDCVLQSSHGSRSAQEVAFAMDPTIARTVSPYVGTRAFDVDDQALFFGRDRECDELRALLSENNFIVLHGSSGSGKTSLLRAGLSPALIEQGDVLPVGRVSLASSFPEAALSPHNPYTLSVLSSWSPGESRIGLSRLSIKDFLADRSLASRWHVDKNMMFVVIDQLEEIFDDTEREQHREEFFRDLGDALHTVPRLKVMLSIRSDCIAELSTYKQLMAINDQAYYFLGPLNRSAAIEAVTRPVEKFSLRFAPGVAEDLIDNLRGMQFRASTRAGNPVNAETIEPVQLQVTCSWLLGTLAPGASIVSFKSPDIAIQVEQALLSFCADVIAEVSSEHEIEVYALRDWLQRTFITSRGRRKEVTEHLPMTAGMPHSVVKSLEKLHILTAGRGSDARWYKLANDRLISVVRELYKPSLVDSTPAVNPSKNLQIAMGLMAEGELTLAERHARHALAAAEGRDLRLQADAWSLLGNIAFQRDLLDIALECYREAAGLCEQLRDQSAVGTLIGAIGRIHVKQGRYVAALEDLHSAVTRLPGNLTLQTELAKVLWHVDQVQAAAAIYGTVLSIEPEFAEALAGRGQIRAETGDASSALDDLRALQRLRPSIGLEPEVRSAYALALARAGKPETAMKEADAALALVHDNALILLRAARVASAIGAPKRATALLRQATEATNPPLSSGRLSEARRLLDSVAKQES